ncbi:sap domain-containing ribonucleoprotein [Anaeramoeba flamelloides]|uniref:Sap domain-containing ribonucleoprotein n=1 Tax=Anaeramoeba flamelloides TaxID=1746091 RepID=A0ABQ8X1E9_9EUKA|nr:sap domain-containing ribonucleoprotein [Anaeramoeba flamelloides]
MTSIKIKKNTSLKFEEKKTINLSNDKRTVVFTNKKQIDLAKERKKRFQNVKIDMKSGSLAKRKERFSNNTKEEKTKKGFQSRPEISKVLANNYSETEKLNKRKEKFGIVSEKEKLGKRKEKFGIVSGKENTNQRKEKFGIVSEKEKLDQRKEKFGIVSEKEKLDQRKEKFGIMSEKEKLDQRKEKFGIVSEKEKLNKRKEKFGNLKKSKNDINQFVSISLDDGIKRGLLKRTRKPEKFVSHKKFITNPKSKIENKQTHQQKKKKKKISKWQKVLNKKRNVNNVKKY